MIDAVSDGFTTWLLIALLAIGLNVVPAFMPPTWALLAYFHLQAGLDTLPLALVGAFGATTGRALLALGSRAIGARILPRRWRVNIETLAAELQRRRELGLPALALFALGPIPSNQLFVAAGLARAPLPPILAVFGVARFVSYVIWISLAESAAATMDELISPRLGAEAATAVQIAALILLFVVMQIDWSRFFGPRR